MAHTFQRQIGLVVCKFVYMQALHQNGRIVAVFIMLDMVDYIGMPAIHSTCELFEMLGKYGRVVEKKLREREWKRGEALYFMYGAVLPGDNQKGFSERFWWSILSIAKLSGYK